MPKSADRDTRPLSMTTGYLYSVYLTLNRLQQELDQACRYMRRAKPWYDRPNRKNGN